MSSPAAALDQPAATEQLSTARNRLVLVVYTAAIFVSALLLFSVQPLFTKMVLPRLGGSPAVWSVAMVFFQSLLLAGYAYAHLLMQIKNRVVPVVVHLALLVAAFVTLPLGIAGAYGEPPSSGYAFWLLGLFVMSIGLPFFALAANNPLLQAWFVRTGHPDWRDPYFLYASSNIGSFLALLSYPFLLEPVFTLLEGRLCVLLARRLEEPQRGMFALPGGFVGVSEAPEQTAERKLQEKTGVGSVHLEQLRTYAEPDRDPRGWLPSKMATSAPRCARHDAA